MEQRDLNAQLNLNALTMAMSLKEEKENDSHCTGSKRASPFPPADKRKRKQVKQYGKVFSTIKSNRAKQAEQVFVCTSVPRREERVKGAVYCINGDNRRWDGRQWRRLCVVEDCHSAARGSGDLCVAHSKGELKKVVLGNEVVEVVQFTEEAIAEATAVTERKVPELLAALAVTDLSKLLHQAVARIEAAALQNPEAGKSDACFRTALAEAEADYRASAHPESPTRTDTSTFVKSSLSWNAPVSQLLAFRTFNRNQK